MSNFVECIKEIFFWKDNIKEFNKAMIEEQKVLMTVVKSDASSTGMAVYILHDRGQKIAFSQFFPERKKKSSTWREFKAIEYSLESLKMFLTQQKVLWKTDNFGVSS